MKTLVFLLVFSFTAFSAPKRMSYQGAFNTIHVVMSQVRMNAQEHAQAEKALKLVKSLVVEKIKEERAAAKVAEEKRIVDAYRKLKEKKASSKPKKAKEKK